MRTLDTNGGFSLIEIIMVIALLTTIMSFGLLATFDSLNGTIFRSERLNIVSVLEKARSRSMTNFFEVSHGACLDTSTAKPRYVNFRSPYSTLNATNEYTDANPAVSINSTSNLFSCTSGGIIFSQLSGKTSNVDVTIVENGRTSVISTNIAGRIDW